MLRACQRFAWLLCLLFLPFSFIAVHAQVISVSVETVQVHTGMVGNSDLTGMTTYRIYANVTDSSDFVGAAYGSAAEPIHLSSTTSFFQHPAGGSFGTDLNAFFLGILPDLNYDSWLTIGLDLAPSDATEEGISSLGMNAELSIFEGGADFVLDSEVGGSWFVLPGSSNGFPDEALRVLLAQVTTDGLLSGTLNLQCFLEGNPFNEQLGTFDFGAGAPGCTDPEACNYDEAANSNDGSCWFATAGYDCEGECLEDADGDGVCDPFEIAGCEDPESCNYAVGVTDPEDCAYAQEGYDCDGMCLMDSDGDGVCDEFEIAGCMDEAACNYLPEATDDGDCDFAELYRDCDGNCLMDTDGDGVCDEEEIVGCTDSLADNYDASATDDDGSCLFIGCMDPVACDYDATANSASSCSYADAGYDCDGACLIDTDEDGICDEFEIAGCTNDLAENFNPLATDDDGSCSVLPPSYCGEGTVWDETTGQCIGDGSSAGDGGVGGYGGPCFGDFDADGQRGTSDLLMWLGVYGYNCD
ncbi:MAG: hypothetical protein O2818_07335 [Bacteroidetes bacterium]|nr:hypothetical protein [Bacteroidota bacterium]MDA1336682.1 hypothetical protein [Bacteroidota bacterium]